MARSHRFASLRDSPVGLLAIRMAGHTVEPRPAAAPRIGNDSLTCEGPCRN